MKTENLAVFLPALEGRLRAVTHEVTALIGESPSDLLNVKPGPDQWSIAQILDHIMVINRSYYPLVDKARHGHLHLPLIARWPGFVRWMGQFIHRSVMPDRKRKMRTFSIWEPSKDDLPEDILQKFRAHQTELVLFFRSCSDLLEKGTIIHSPAHRMIVYTLAKAMEIMVTHEERHFQQIRETWERVNSTN